MRGREESMREKESKLSAQEKAVRQQELLEQKRRAVAAKNAETDAAPTSERDRSWAMREKLLEDKEVMEKYVSVSRWFLSICWMQIPVIGIIYVFVLAFGRKTPPAKKSFARAYLLYRVLVLFLTVVIIYVLYRIGVNFIDGILQYVK